MDSNKLLEVIGVYRHKFHELEAGLEPYPHEELLPKFFSHPRALSHLRQMLPTMEQFIEEGRLEKAFRWLGFVQGVLWTLRIYSLEELKEHSRPR